MKKNGFIATSLIYSFFLIFITLFLTIIADYLQDKVLLNTIEKGIKDDLNSTMGINDFEVGDVVNFDNNPTDTTHYPDWVIAKVDYRNKNIILYSIGTEGTFPNGKTTRNIVLNDFLNDIEFGYRNSTYINKIIYQTELDAYYVGNYDEIDKCISINCTTKQYNGEYDEFDLKTNNCINTCTVRDTRKRLELNVGTENYTKIEVTGNGTILLEYK